MQFDSYDTPGTETLLQVGRQRYLDGGDGQRLLLTEAAAAAAFLVAAGALAVLGSSTRSFSPTVLVATVVAYLVAAQCDIPSAAPGLVPCSSCSCRCCSCSLRRSCR
jgi:hypothetical protein